MLDPVDGFVMSLERTQHTPEQASNWMKALRGRQTGDFPPRAWTKYNPSTWFKQPGQVIVDTSPIIPLDDYTDEVWIGNITIGTPSQGHSLSFSLLFELDSNKLRTKIVYSFSMFRSVWRGSGYRFRKPLGL